MSFADVIGQHHAKGILHRTIVNERVSHAYLFSGAAGVGKEALAIEFAKALFCSGEGEKPCDECSSCRRVRSFQHPDFVFVFPSSAKTVEEERAILDSVMENPYSRNKPWATPTIGIEQIREIRHAATLRPMEGRRVVIVAEADKMTIPAANSLLKILEEPPETMYLILTASQVSSLLPTILSRCQEIRFGPLPDNEIEWALIEKKAVDPVRAQLISRVSQGSYAHALEWLRESFSERRENVIEFLRFCLKDPRSQIELVEQLVRDYDKKIIKEILSLSLMWFRDALILAESPASVNHLVNIDQLETVKKFVGAFESIDYHQVFIDIENSIQMIEKNIQINLILIVLMIKLRQALKLKGRQT
ncbi:DNA polymerase III subunit delta' [candidate division KSB1 bacterium]|nr:DNA polymerase III subunit delta' [candidate division KSB1 bacterium]